MPGITGQATTFAVPNYVGELFAITPEETPFLSAIGGLTGGRRADATLFTWQTYDLRDPDTSRQALEGDDAPTAEARTRSTHHNVLEIHHEALDISYSKQSFPGQFASTGSNNANSVAVTGTNPIADELTWQQQQALKQIARDVEATFISGTFQNPADNATPRKTRGILQAIETNVVAANNAVLTEDMILNLMQDIWESGGIAEAGLATLMCAGHQRRKLTKIFVTDKGYIESSRTIGGVSVQTILTDFGRLNIMLNRYMPTDAVAVVSLSECAPRFGEVPGKGFLFTEPLARTGSSDKYQMYGEIGLEYGVESHHGKITDLNTAAGS